MKRRLRVVAGSITVGLSLLTAGVAFWLRLASSPHPRPTVNPLYIGQLSPEEARAELQQLDQELSNNPDQRLLWEKRILIGVRFDPQMAIADCQTLLANDSADPFALSHLGAAYLKLNRTDKARHYAALSLQQAPSVLAHNVLGQVFLQEKHTDKAKNHFEQALQLDADDQFAQSMLERLTE